MHLLVILAIAIGLAMDAFAVSIASGIALRRPKLWHAVWIGLSFGFFQAAMPLVGWYAGRSLYSLISSVDHWIAFGLLTLIGGRLIYESRRIDPRANDFKPLEPQILLLLAVATSIDALAVGVTFAFIEEDIVIPILLIGVVTFALSTIGVFLGGRLGHHYERPVEVIGGLILIGVGLKILIEHTLL